jgi:hypothetical protein
MAAGVDEVITIVDGTAGSEMEVAAGEVRSVPRRMSVPHHWDLIVWHERFTSSRIDGTRRFSGVTQRINHKILVDQHGFI